MLRFSCSPNEILLMRGIGCLLTLLLVIFLQSFASSPKQITNDSPNSTANWCLEHKVKEVLPNDLEFSLNYSRVARFFEESRFAVNTFVSTYFTPVPLFHPCMEGLVFEGRDSRDDLYLEEHRFSREYSSAPVAGAYGSHVG